MKQLIAFLSLVVASGLLFSNMYTSVVDARSWGSNIPESIAAARQYYQHANPGDFFRIFSPVNQILALLVLILLWKQFPGLRIPAAAVLLLYIAGDIFTFTFFYPRNEFMFEKASLTDIEGLKKTWNEWRVANWFRSLLLVIGICISFFIIRKVFAKS